MRVFASYRSVDRALVEPHIRRLEGHDYAVTFDDWSFVAGQAWATVIEGAIAAADAMVVFLGPNPAGPVQRAEIDLALNRSWDPEDAFRMVTVLLPGAPDPERNFLSLSTWVDLRDDTAGHGWNKLVGALAGQAPGPPEYQGTRCPYPGLTAFGREDAALFFGRETEIQALRTRLEDAFTFNAPRLITLVGASGTGKSSLVRAGLLPRLAQEGKRWRIAECRPGKNPLRAVAVAVARAHGEHSLARLDELTEAIGARPAALADWHRMRAPDDAHRLLILIDQLEEALVQCVDSNQRTQFFELLSHVAHANAPVAIIATLRADFLAQALASSTTFAHTLQATQELVVGLSPSGLRDAIRRPAIERGRRIDQALVRTLITSIERSPADLPLLQFMLARLWARSTRRIIDGHDYQQLGGLRGTLARYADEVTEGLRAQRATVRRLMCALVHLVDDAPHTRRRLPRARLEATIEGCGPVIDQLVMHRLLVVREDGVEVAHEALIRHWARLRAWIAEDRIRLGALQEVETAADLWVERGRSEDDLWRGGRLAEVQRLHLQSHHLAPTSAAFLEAAHLAEAARRAAEAAAAAELQSAYDDAQRRLSDAIEVADLIHSTASRELTRPMDLPIARRTLINAAVTLLERLGVQRDPDVDRTLMLTLIERGEVDLTHGSLGDARACFERAHEIATTLAGDPDDIVAAFDVIITFGHLAQMTESEGDLQGAIDLYREAIEMDEALLVRWPDDLDLVSAIAVDQSKLALVLAEDGQLDEALNLAQRALDNAPLPSQTIPTRSVGSQQRSLASLAFTKIVERSAARTPCWNRQRRSIAPLLSATRPTLPRCAI